MRLVLDGLRVFDGALEAMQSEVSTRSKRKIFDRRGGEHRARGVRGKHRRQRVRAPPRRRPRAPHPPVGCRARFRCARRYCCARRDRSTARRRVLDAALRELVPQPRHAARLLQLAATASAIAAPHAIDLVLQLGRRHDRWRRAPLRPGCSSSPLSAPRTADLVRELHRGVRAGKVIDCHRAQGRAARASLASPFRVLMRWSNRQTYTPAPMRLGPELPPIKPDRAAVSAPRSAS